VSVAAVGLRTALLLAAPDDNIPPGKGPEWGKAAPIGLLIILLLGLSLFFLIKNMNKQFRKVPDSFDPPSEDEVGESGGPDASEHEGPGQQGHEPVVPDGQDVIRGQPGAPPKDPG